MEEYQIFISYRRVGGEDMAGRIADRLRRLGYSVFYDVESMRAGKFNSQIYEAIDNCHDVLVILPPNALDRCVNPDDWVRIEIAYAIEKKKNIIPILMNGFEFPADLPDEISTICDYEGIRAPSGFFDALMTRLISLLTSPKSTSNSYSENSNYSEIMYENGASYSGGIVNGLFHGRGVLKYATGDTYSGLWEGGVRSGEGVLTWKNGEQWKGDFFEGNPYNGKGSWVYYTNTDEVKYFVYKGAIINGKREGEALIIWENGDICKGTYKNDSFFGAGTWYDKSGKYVGSLVNNKRHGKGTIDFSKSYLPGYFHFEGRFNKGYAFYGKLRGNFIHYAHWPDFYGEFNGFFKKSRPFLGKWTRIERHKRNQRHTMFTLFGWSFGW